MNRPEMGENIIFPDYHKLAGMINTLLKQGRLGDVEVELHKLYQQGYYLGRREGYQDGLDNGWAKEQDRAELLKELREIEYTQRGEKK